ncbi:MerR family transcriptional regulator [Companilactobacillus ginsenosidimutans]|uniref:HTH merR-type domain-containing protein n=1 Tax=Companilactobacillus ginsenosidimutans TaxID=1007676 RepID=A0A0H4R1V8_9LACO|nr:MerR family transcriptional regulator [Companilactobacillus ginsenosidimutans]AKP67720.1 hypothetical protein ABM34_09400 [Companilactobacillus ginsenosidimutans]
MSQFTTGELAKLSNISVRTLQYYDKKDLLYPSSKTESGRRIYNDDDWKRLKLILLLKGMGLSLEAIKEILNSPNTSSILKLMLDEQEKRLKQQVADSQSQLKSIENMKRNLSDLDNVTIKNIDDIDRIMTNKKSLWKVHRNMLLFGLLIDVVEIGSLIYGFMTGKWIPFTIGMILVLICAGILSKYYFEETNYICPNCNYEFKPRFWKAFWAKHNLRARKLVCPNCGQQNYCVEVFDDTKTKR